MEINEDQNNDQQLYDSKIESLLDEFSNSRSELSNYIAEVDNIRKKVSDIFPKTSDFRNRFVLEEKIKAASSFFSTLLSIRQEFNKSIKEEIDIRRKLENLTDNGNPLDDIEVDQLANMVEDELKQRKRKQSNIKEKIKEEKENIESEES